MCAYFSVPYRSYQLTSIFSTELSGLCFRLSYGNCVDDLIVLERAGNNILTLSEFTQLCQYF